MDFLKIALKDISNIFKNRFIRISVVSIIVVPLLYSLLYLYAFWDPYSKLSSLPVAVVNEDIGGLNDNEKVNYGQDIIDKLKDNTELNWQIVSLEDAEKGTLSGDKYYAEFIIPKDFSAKILKAKTDEPEQPEILYVANEKRNFLASQINGKVETLLKADIMKSITSEFTKVTFDNLYDVKDALKKASDGSSELKDGLIEASDGSNTLKDGLGTLNSSVPDLSSGIKQLYSGSQTLSTKLNDAEKGASALNDGTTQLFTGVDKLNSGLNSVNDGANNLNDGISNLNTGVNKLNSGAVNVNDGAKQLANGLNGVYDANGSPVVIDGEAQIGLKNGVKQLVTGINNAKDGVNQVAGGINGIYKDGSAVVVDGVPQVGLKKGTAQIATSIDTLASKINSSEQNLEDSLAIALKNYEDSNPSISTDDNFKQLLVELNKAVKNNTLSDSDVNSLKNNAHNVANGAAQLSSGINQLSTGMNTLADGVNTVNDGTQKLASGSIALVEGTKQLSDGSSQLVDGTKKLSFGSSQLADGTKQLSFGSSQLVDGTKKLSDGSSQLADGTKQLYDGSAKLSDGLGTLNGKIPGLSSGSLELYNGAQSLTTGLNKLKDGGIELSDKLKEGSDKVNDSLVNSSQTMADYVSEPIAINEQPFETVKNYGTGFAPYFIPLSLWVGAMLMFFVITDKVDIEGKFSSSSLVLGKFLSYGFIGILQAVLTAVAVLALGLQPNNMFLYFVFNIFMSYVFIAIIQCLVFLFGQAGRLLAIVMLILQLTACAGTFPIELVPPFFKILNPFMPFTYCVNALREIISGNNIHVILNNASLLAIVMICFLFLSISLKQHTDKIKEKIEIKKNANM